MSERTTEASQLTSRPSPTTVALAIPAYNEADGIGEFLHELDRCLGAAGFDATFVVVNDRSTDETAAVLTTVGPALAGQLLAVTAESNRGHGPTAHDAYTRCLDTGAAFVLQVDGDGQFDGDDVVAVLRHAVEHDVATVGRRRTRLDPWFRRILTRAVRGYLRVGFRVASPDPNSPLRVYPRDVLTQLLPRVPADALIPNIYLTVLAHRSSSPPEYLTVTHRVRRGTEAQGTMWRSKRRTVLIPTRLLTFVRRAAAESLSFRRSIRHAA